MIIVLQGFAMGSLYRWGGGSGSAAAAAGAVTGKLVHPIFTHYTNITTSWWWLALLSALGGR
ncbi:MAG: hypothetical protein HY323_14475 [Betaproteobacteria bacterium]|nr:hypothetical protein [Betaproteobacteria bacterium]